MPKISPQDGASKWARRTKAATQDVAAGVDRVTENPGTKAIAAKEKMIQRFMDALQSGKFERALQRMTLQDWQRAMKEVGVGRIAQGVDAKGTPKMQAFAEEFYPFLERVQQQIANMPDVTLEDSIQRMVTNVREIAEFKRGG
jgi:hypothetical protein